MARRLASAPGTLPETTGTDLTKAVQEKAYTGVFKLQGSRRIGPSSETERQEGFAVRESARKALEEAIAKQKAAATEATAAKMADLRKQLGIDDLLQSLQGQQYSDLTGGEFDTSFFDFGDSGGFGDYGDTGAGEEGGY